MRKTIWMPGIAAALAMLSSCTKPSEVEATAAAAEIPVVAVVTATRENISNDLSLTAEFEPYQEVDVMAKVTGYLKEIPVDIGDRVHAGQVLATLELPELEDDRSKAAAAIDEATAEGVTARDEWTRAASAHEIAHLSYTRILDVAKREPGLIPQQDVDEAHSRDLVSEAQVASAESRMKANGQHIRVLQAEHTRIKTLQQYTTITAPFDGVVTKRYANVGSMMQTQGMPVVRLSQNNLLRLILPVPESAAAAVHRGQAVNVRVPTAKRTITGQVTRFAEKVQMSTRTMDTEVDVPNPDLALIPGMYADVDVALERHDRTVCVPPDAIDGLGSATPRVYAVEANGAIHILPIRTGIETAQRVEVISGLHEGQSLVVGRHSDLTEGKPVRTKAVNFDGSAAGK